MANCHNLLVTFNTDVLTLRSSRLEALKRAKRSLRERIRKYFDSKDNGLRPRFHGQGSFSMGTSITPIDGHYDLDDGIYFLVEDELTVEPTTVHKWIVEAVDGHTQQSPIDKNTCVRVRYARDKDGLEYHVDLPIYYKTEGQHPHLAHKCKGWIESDPRDLVKWFKNHCQGTNGQMQRLVRYFKAWRDHRGLPKPKSFVLTILIAKYYQADSRDDIALRNTIAAVHQALTLSFSCRRPTVPVGEELLGDVTEVQKTQFLKELADLVKYADYALNASTQKDAALYWEKRIFGERFPSAQASEEVEGAKRQNTSPVIRTEARSASRSA